jgi:hypothetical protein
VNLIDSNAALGVEGIDPRAGEFLQFTSDGKGVAYSITDQGIGTIWWQPTDGSKVRQLTNFPSGTISGFHWSPDGKSLWIHREQSSFDVVTLRDSHRRNFRSL